MGNLLALNLRCGRARQGEIRKLTSLSTIPPVRILFLPLLSAILILIFQIARHFIRSKLAVHHRANWDR